jgi:hypothetical protein
VIVWKNNSRPVSPKTGDEDGAPFGIAKGLSAYDPPL